MFEINQVLFYNGNPPTRHVIDEKVKVVDADGKERYLYHITGYGAYFDEPSLINDFLVPVPPAAEAEREKGKG